ncbi:MAG: hypothetical protein Q9180_008870, partial [Flavoplaca navasiana]
SCRLPIIGRICSPPNAKPLEMGPYWEEEVDIKDLNNIPHVLNSFRSNCKFYEGLLENLSPGSGISQQQKNEVLEGHREICVFLDGLHTEVPNFYRHVSTFTARLITRIETTDLEIEKTLNESLIVVSAT